MIQCGGKIAQVQVQTVISCQLSYQTLFNRARCSIYSHSVTTINLDISTANKRDSAAMNTISVVTMAFLQDTFVAVSTQRFFEYPPETDWKTLDNIQHGHVRLGET